MSILLAVVMTASPNVQEQRATAHTHATILEVGRLSRAPLDWLGKKLQLCGAVSDSEFGRILSRRYERDTEAVYISPDLKPDPIGDAALRKPAGNEACYTGIWSRVDGKTNAQIFARGYESLLSHGIDSEYILSALSDVDARQGW